jgi:hypothetical protein
MVDVGATAEKVVQPVAESQTGPAVSPAGPPAQPTAAPATDAKEEKTQPAGTAKPGEEKAAPPLLALEPEPTARPRPPVERFGTSVEFVSRPADGARLAREENKLLFVLHLSGNFEDACFT